MRKQYRLVDNATEEILMEGHVKEVADFTGASKSHIAQSSREGKTICGGQYRVVDISVEENDEKYKPDTGLWVAARHWDEFCEPLRKKYNIPVYRPGKGEKK
jgi:multidrug resistance efflux pump